MKQPNYLLATLRELNQQLDADLSLRALAGRNRRSLYQFHRDFRRFADETPKQYTLRVRLERAAATLVATRESVLSLALAHGFSTHEVFTRAFRRHFGCTPVEYRRRRRGWSVLERDRHAHLVHQIAPCLRLFRISTQTAARRAVVSASTIVRKVIAPQPILFIRRRVLHSQLKDMFGECFGALFMYGHQAGLPIAGWPGARYVAMGPGLWTVDAFMPLAAPVSAPAGNEMQPGELFGGAVAFAVHSGPYEQLPETNAAIEHWIEANGLRTGGHPWESYVTDPAQHPDPKDWKTEVYWPLA